MPGKLFGLLVFITCVNGQVTDIDWNTLYSGREGYTDYTSDDNLYGLSDEYAGKSYSQTCGGCICPTVNSPELVCTGPSIELYRKGISQLNRTSFTSSTNVTSVQIRHDNVFEEIYFNDTGAFDDLVNLHTLIIQYTSLKDFPNIENTAISILDLAGNAVNFFTANWTRQHLPDPLTYVSLRENNIHWLPDRAFADSNVRIMSLSNNNIFQFPSSAVDNMASLLYLGLDGNEIRTVSVNQLSTLVASNIQHLNLHTNQIYVIEQNALSQLKTLTILELQNNQLGTIPLRPQMMHAMSLLLHLDLSSNSLTELNAETLTDMPNLETLKLNNNGLVKIEYNAFRNISNSLTEIHLSDNSLTTFPHQVLSQENYTSLSIIYADGNSISNVVEFGNESFPLRMTSLYDVLNASYVPFSTVPSVTELHLQNNVITQLETSDFCEMSILQKLYLDENLLTEETIMIDTFQCLTQLEILGLSSNSIQYVPEAVRRKMYLPSIIDLDLASNIITFIPTNAFTELDTLQILSLQLNCILTVEDQSFPYQSLSVLRLQSNRFRFLHHHPFQNLSVLSTLNLENNFITVIPDDAFHNSTSLDNLNLANNDIKRVLITHFQDNPLSQGIQLASNDIGYIEDGTFDHVTDSIHIDLSDNFLHNIPLGGTFQNMTGSTATDFTAASNYITSLPTGSFRDFSGRDITFTGNKISHIYSGAFSNVAMRDLDLSGNPLNHLYAYAFNHTSHHSSGNINMSPVGATVIPALTFNDVSVGGSIYLQNSAVELIQTAAFNDVSATYLDLGSSDTTIVEEEAFINLSLTHLILSNNQISEFGGSIFGGSCSISEWLRLNNNQLSRLPDDSFSDCGIQYIDLSNNVIVEYPATSLDLTSLQTIKISNNLITELPLGSFTSANSALRELDISYNKIKVLLEDLFSDLSSLQKLYLENNEISSIQPGAFDGLNSLQYLYLQNNMIQFFPAVSLGELRGLDLSNNLIESIEPDAFKDTEKLASLSLSNNPLACDCFLYVTLNATKAAIISGSCQTPEPALANGLHFIASQADVLLYFQDQDNAAETYFQCAGDNLNVQALAEYELRVTFNAPASLYPIHPDAVTISNISATTTAPSSESNVSTTAASATERTYTVECTSTSSVTLTKDIVDSTGMQTDFQVTFDKEDGVEPGVTYTCRLALTLGSSDISAKNYPVFVTSLTSLNTTVSVGPNDYLLNTLYYDFAKSHPDFYKVTSIRLEDFTYMKSPYGNWVTQSDLLLSSSMADWFRFVPGTNVEVEGNLVLTYNSTTGKHRYWTSNFYPVDTLGYGHENQRDCYSVLHNFGFTSVIKGGLMYKGNGSVAVAGGEQIWLAINKTLLLDINVQPTDTEIPCKMVDLTPAAETGGGWIIPMLGTLDPVSGECVVSSNLEDDQVWLQLEVGNTYHFEVFHAERKPCSSQLLIETSELEFYQVEVNGTDEPATDYFLYVKEDLHENGILGSAELYDDFSTGSSFQVTILTGNEARHFTLKDNTTANLLSGVAPSVAPLSYTRFPGVSTPFVECHDPVIKIPEPEFSGVENFNVNSQSALVTLDTAIDREVKDRYLLSLEVIDSSTTPARTGSIVILIQVHDVNDNCPVIIPGNLTFEPVPSLHTDPLFYVTVTDDDINQNGEVYYDNFYDATVPPLRFKYNISMDYYALVYNESSDLYLFMAFLDRGTDPVRGTVIKPKVTLSNSCLLTLLFEKISTHVEVNDTSGEVRLKLPGYWVDIYECPDVVGLSSGWVVDSQLSASSSLDISSLPGRARINITHDAAGELFGGWVAATNDVNQYWAIDFLETHRVLEVMIQGREDAEMWVESFKLQYLNDSGVFTEYTDNTNSSVFTGSSDQNTIVTTVLDPLIITQILRIHPQSWHGGIALRVEILGCTVADYIFYNTRCRRCNSGSYCPGDGTSTQCASECDTDSCEVNATEHSFGGYDTCAPCPEGWLCNNGIAQPCPLYHYAVCENNTCEESCRPCPAGSACLGGVITECRQGSFAEALSANCSLCTAGTYQNQTGQDHCINCPAGYESASAMDHCNPCPEETYSTGDGQPCQPCVDASLCACENEVPPCFVKDENLKVACRNTAYDGTSFDCDSCPPGYVGDGITCTDIDECTDYSPCFNGRCINEAPGYQCLSCPHGYTGYFKDGRSADLHNRLFLCDGDTNTTDVLVEQICEDIDECSTDNGNCDFNAHCYNSMGNYECGPCKKGYLGSSFYGCHIDNYCISGNNSCSEHATCVYAGPGAYRCVCKDGYTGTGLECEKDTDLDGHPDQSLSTCLGFGCKRDNCPTVPNSGQEDNDKESLGDNCDLDDDNDVVTDILDNCLYVYNPWKTDTDGDGIGDDCDNCVSVNNTEQTDTDGDSIGDECDPDIDDDGVLNGADNCPKTANADQTDSDGDGVGNACDNCPSHSNADQMDADENGFGDVCSPVNTVSTDRDGDGISNEIDNCPFFANPQQSDIDNDGTGDDCDEDSDGDGILNHQDNCILVSNSDQQDTDENTVGDACEGDSDGDSVADTEDHCPHNPAITDTSFKSYTIVYPDPSIVDTDALIPEFRVNHDGKEILMTQPTNISFMLLGDTYYSDVEYSGTWYVDGDSGEDYIGFVFGYQTSSKYYVVMMKYENTNRDTCIGGLKGLQIKVMDSSSGPGKVMGDALWLSHDTTNQARLLWQDPTMYNWQHKGPLRWHLIWQASTGYINVRVVDSEGVEMVNSGDLYDTTIQGGRLGVFAFNQSDVYWSHLTARCTEPQNWALYFDGVDDYVQLAEIYDYEIHESFTIEVWIKCNDSGIPGKQPIVCTLDSSICLYLENDIVVGQVGQSVAFGTNVLPADYWHHITFRYEFQTETIDLYINGTGSGAEGSATDAVGVNDTTTDTILFLGRDRNSYFEGFIDEVRIYKRWIPESYLDNYITSFNPEWSFHQKHLTGHFTMNYYNPWNATFVQDSGIYSLHGEAFGNPSFKQDTLNFAVFELAHPTN